MITQTCLIAIMHIPVWTNIKKRKEFVSSSIQILCKGCDQIQQLFDALWLILSGPDHTDPLLMLKLLRIMYIFII